MPFSDLSDPTFWIPTVISIVAVVLFYVDMRWRLKQEQAASISMLGLISAMREELQLFREQLSKGKLTSEELERQKLLQGKQEHQWRIARDFFKGIGRLLERSEDEN